MNEERRELLAKLASPQTGFEDKLRLVAALDQMDSQEREAAQLQKELDWADMSIKETFSPVVARAYGRVTDETDWLGDFTASQHSPHEIYAHASTWYSSLDSDVKADAEEFLIQAQGYARHITGSLGERAEMGEREFMDYVAFLNRDVLAASGLDQVAQEYDPKDEYKPTPYPTEVFDNFAPEVNEYATTTPRGSDQSPNMNPGGPGQVSGRPSRHDAGDVKLNDAPNENFPSVDTSTGQESGEPSRHGGVSASLNSGDDQDFFSGSVQLPSLTAESRGTGWWQKFRERLKGRPKGKHRMNKESPENSAPAQRPRKPGEGHSSSGIPADRVDNIGESGGKHRGQEKKETPGKHRRPEDMPSRGQHAGEQTYKPKHRKGVEPPKPGKRRKDSGSGSEPHRPEKGQGTPSGDRRHRTQPSRNQGRPTSGPPQTVNHGNRPAPGRHRSTDPLTDPQHKVRDTGTPIHDRAKRAKDPTPMHDKVKQDRATDDHIRRELDRRQRGEPSSVREIKNPGDRKNQTQKRHTPTFSHAQLRPSEAASGLDQIQQTVNVHDEQDTRPMPEEVAFPMREDWPETSTDNMNILTNERQAMLEMAQKLAAQAEALIKQADMWGNSDTPRPVPGPAVENSPHTTPDEGTGDTYEQGYAQGRMDKLSDDAPTYSDASSAAPEYVRGYSKGFSETDYFSGPQTVPSSLGGDNGQAVNSDRIRSRKELPLSMGGFKASAVFTSESALESPDFRKGYAYARKWTPEVPLVSLGSSEFEAGVYAGITDNPENQSAFVTANQSYEELSARMATHKDFTREIWTENDGISVKGSYVQAATTTDLNMNSPTVSPDPFGATPVMGPGTPPLHEGMEDPARPGGPAPYNGAEPFGQPVVYNPVVGPTQDSGPRNDQNVKLTAFRNRIQASLEEEGQS